MPGTRTCRRSCRSRSIRSRKRCAGRSGNGDRGYGGNGKQTEKRSNGGERQKRRFDGSREATRAKESTLGNEHAMDRLACSFPRVDFLARIGLLRRPTRRTPRCSPITCLLRSVSVSLFLRLFPLPL